MRLAPENALVRYRRAKILVSMRKYGVGSRLYGHPEDPPSRLEADIGVILAGDSRLGGAANDDARGVECCVPAC